MQRRGLILLVAATGIVTVAAVVPGANAPGTTGGGDSGQPVLAGLADHPSDAAAIELRGGTGRVTLRRRGAAPSADGGTAAEVWVVAERGDYLADQAKVRAALLALARLRLIEPKTSRADLYARLGVEDPAGPDAGSVLVRISDDRGATIGEVIVGRTRHDRLGSGEDGIYVRHPNEVRAWLAEGSLDATALAADWLDKAVAAIPAARIRRVVITRPDGTTLDLGRRSAGEAFTLADAPPDATYIAPVKRNATAGVLDGLRLTDIRPAAAAPAPNEDTVRTEWTTFDGLTVAATLTDADGAHWLRLSASATEDKAAGEARTLNLAWSRWVYAIADSRAGAVGIARADILEAPKTP